MLGAPTAGEILLPPNGVFDVKEVFVVQDVLVDFVAERDPVLGGVVRDHEVDGATFRVISDRPAAGAPSADGLDLRELGGHGTRNAHRIDLELGFGALGGR